MASVTFDTGKQGFRVSYREGAKENRRKRSIWLGDVSESFAKEFAKHLDHLLTVRDISEPPAKATMLWLADLPDKFHGKLSAAELVECREIRPRSRSP